MFIFFNVLVVAFILLIAYWWGNQGLFSSILHLVSVIAAGAVAFGFWELATMPLLNTGFGVYAWGFTLVGMFAVCLLLFRKLLDNLAPANVNIPHWANLTFGGVVGLVSGTLTVGILLIGLGHLQSHRAIVGWIGTARSTQSGKVAELQTLWVPAHTLTYKLYGYMSANSMWTPNAMRHVAPALDRQASLIRDSYKNGSGAVAMSPDGVQIVSNYVSNDGQIAYVTVQFTSKSIDFNDQLTLSQSQIRLIGSENNRFKDAQAIEPYAWTQEEGSWPFESLSYYLTSTSGQEASSAVLEFRLPNGFVPKFLQLKGTRFQLPAQAVGSLADAAVGLSGAGSREELDTAAPNIDTAFNITSDLRPLYLGTNNLAGMSHDNLWLTDGEIIQASSGNRPGKNLRIKGVYSPAGAQVVQVRIDPRSAANAFDRTIWNQLPENSEFKLVDAQGRSYRPVGYFHKRADNRYKIFLKPGESINTSVVPFVPGSGNEELKLIFRVTVGETIVGLKVGDITIGTCSQTIEKEDRPGI